MKARLLLAFSLTVIMIIIMRWQGNALITPVSPNGIIDVEFAKSSERLRELQLFLNSNALKTNLYLDFIFIAAYTWFLFAACYFFAENRGRRSGAIFTTVALAAGMFDVLENLLLLMILNGRFSSSLILFVYYIALIKFVLVALVLLYLVIILLSLILKTRTG